VVGWGCALNMWTLRHGSLIGDGARVVQVDSDAAALGAHRRVDLGVAGDVAATARAVAELLDSNGPDDGEAAAGPDDGAEPASGPELGYRTAAVRTRIAAEVRWRDVPFTDESYAGRIDPRTLSIALDDLLPAERVVAVDSGNFMGYPSMYLSVPDQDGFTFTQAYQSVGLGLGSAIGSAIARPDRLTVAALGDGGFLMAAGELETVVRLGLPMVVVVYDDEAYGAEAHHFGPEGYPLDTVQFPAADLAAIGRGYGCAGVTVRGPDDLGPVADWLAGDRDRPLVIDAKVVANRGSWWLEEAFRGH
jgi:acetolactate synthase I/II/III large subunit